MESSTDEYDSVRGLAARVSEQTRGRTAAKARRIIDQVDSRRRTGEILSEHYKMRPSAALEANSGRRERGGWWWVLLTHGLGALGALLGAAIGAAAYQPDPSGWDLGRGFEMISVAILLGGLGVAVGLVVSLLIGMSRWRARRRRVRDGPS
jgi:hypothetical protein